MARPDRGSLKLHEIVAAKPGGAASASASSTGLGLSRASLPFTESNAVLVAGRQLGAAGTR